MSLGINTDNHFFYNTKTKFYEVADEKDLTPHKIVVIEGAKGLESGSEFLFDAGASIVPGAGTGMTVVKVSDNLDKMAKSESWQEAAEHGFNATGDVLEEATGDIGYTAINVSDVVAAVRERMSNLFFNKDDKSETKGKIIVKDKNPKTQKPIVIAQKKGGGTSSDGSPSVYVTGRQEYLSKGVDLLVKAGICFVTLVNSDGFRETVEVKVEPGKETVVEIDTSPPKQKEEEKPSSDTKILRGYNFQFIPDLGLNYEFTWDDDEEIFSGKTHPWESMSIYLDYDVKSDTYFSYVFSEKDGVEYIRDKYTMKIDVENKILTSIEVDDDPCWILCFYDIPATVWSEDEIIVFEISGSDEDLAPHFGFENKGCENRWLTGMAPGYWTVRVELVSP